MFRTFQILCTIAIALMLSSAALAQDAIKPPKDGATRAELEKWLVNALTRHASYNTRSTSVSVTGIKLTGCTISFTVLRKLNPKNNDTVNAVLKTKGVKHDVEFDIARIEPNGIEITDYLLPEFQNVVVRERYGQGNSPDGTTSRTIEIVVKYEAAEAIRSALERLRDQCSGGT